METAGDCRKSKADSEDGGMISGCSGGGGWGTITRGDDRLSSGGGALTGGGSLQTLHLQFTFFHTTWCHRK